MSDSLADSERSDNAVICRFYGGPWDGREETREAGNTPFELAVPQLAERAIGGDVLVPERITLYRRGHIREGIAYYRAVVG